MEPEGSLPCSQGPSTGPYPQPVQSTPYHPILSLLIKINYVYYVVFEVHIARTMKWTIMGCDAVWSGRSRVLHSVAWVTRRSSPWRQCVLLNASKLMPDYTASHLRRQYSLTLISLDDNVVSCVN
jgi:hypothetical protein